MYYDSGRLISWRKHYKLTLTQIVNGKCCLLLVDFNIPRTIKRLNIDGGRPHDVRGTVGHLIPIYRQGEIPVTSVQPYWRVMSSLLFTPTCWDFPEWGKKVNTTCSWGHPVSIYVWGLRPSASSVPAAIIEVSSLQHLKTAAWRAALSQTDDPTRRTAPTPHTR